MQASAFEQARERFAQGVIATEQKKYPEAIQIFNALIKDFPNLPEPYNNLAVLYASQGDLVQAASLLQQAVRIDPTTPPATKTWATCTPCWPTKPITRPSRWTKCAPACPPSWR